jgi:hypothetical protein
MKVFLMNAIFFKVQVVKNQNVNSTFLGFKWGYIKKFHPTILNSFTPMKSQEISFKSILDDYQRALQDIENTHVLESNNAITLQSREMSKRC